MSEEKHDLLDENHKIKNKIFISKKLFKINNYKKGENLQNNNNLFVRKKNKNNNKKNFKKLKHLNTVADKNLIHEKRRKSTLLSIKIVQNLIKDFEIIKKTPKRKLSDGDIKIQTNKNDSNEVNIIKIQI